MTPDFKPKRPSQTGACKRGHVGGRYASGACKECNLSRDRELNATVPGRGKAHNDKRRSDPAKRAQDYERAKRTWHANYKTDPRPALWRGARHRARQDNLPFNITVDDIAIPARCPVLLIPLACNKGTPGPGSPSIDKLIPELGYVRGNVTVISYKANSIKRDATPEELMAVANYVRKQYPQWLLAT